MILSLVACIVGVGVSQHLRKRVVPLEGESGSESPLRFDDQAMVRRVAALVAVTRADPSTSHRRGRDGLELGKRPQRLRYRAELLYSRIGEVGVRYGNIGRAREWRSDIRAQQVQGAGGS